MATIRSSVQLEVQPLIYPRLAIQLVVYTQALWSDLQLFDSAKQVLMSCYDTQHLDSHTFGVHHCPYMRDIIIQLNILLRKYPRIIEETLPGIEQLSRCILHASKLYTDHEHGPIYFTAVLEPYGRLVADLIKYLDKACHTDIVDYAFDITFRMSMLPKLGPNYNLFPQQNRLFSMTEKEKVTAAEYGYPLAEVFIPYLLDPEIYLKCVAGRQTVMMTNYLDLATDIYHWLLQYDGWALQYQKRVQPSMLQLYAHFL